MNVLLEYLLTGVCSIAVNQGRLTRAHQERCTRVDNMEQGCSPPEAKGILYVSGLKYLCRAVYTKYY